MAARRHRSSSGQAIVIVALVIVVMFGFLGLAVDGGRAYLDRRGLQAAVDSAALGAAFNYMNNADYTAAEQAATGLYANNEGLYMSPTCAGYGTVSVTCTFDDPTSHVMSIAVVNKSIAGVTFTVTGRHTITASIMQVLGSTSMPIAATATALARRAGTNGAAIQTLAPAGCGGNGGQSLTFQGSSQTYVTGDIWSNGSIFDNSAVAGGSVNGNVIDICGTPPALNTPSPWTVSGTQANGWTMPDPGYPMPALNTDSQTWNSASGSVEQPGTYNADPKLTASAGCYFLAGGVYDFNGGFTQNGGFVSNELRPPDEPALAGTTAALSGSISAIPVTALATPTCYLRETAPSMCKTVALGASGVIKVSVTADPGAQYYGVYLAQNASCTGLAYVTSFANTGSSSVTINSSTFPAGWPTGQPSPPDPEGLPLASGLPNASPPAGAPPRGDLANEGHCADPTTGANASCPGTWTPGAIVLFIPSGGCIDLHGKGDIYVFSGFQYNRVMLFEPGPLQSSQPNTCTGNNVNGNGYTSLIGIFYMPAAGVTINGNSAYQATIAGGVIAWTASIIGTGNVAILADPTLRKWPSTVRLTQ